MKKEWCQIGDMELSLGKPRTLQKWKHYQIYTSQMTQGVVIEYGYVLVHKRRLDGHFLASICRDSIWLSFY